jgi:hypothetical protein
MSSGPETRFTASVHRLLPPENVFHREKMANPYRGGTADSWYSGNLSDLWVEWKFIEIPKLSTTMIDLVGGKKPTISMLQQDWLEYRYKEGRHVAVIVGSKTGGVIFDTPAQWMTPINTATFYKWLVSRNEIAQYILEFCKR